MREEQILVVAQLLSVIKDNIQKLKEVQKKKDAEQLAFAKRETLTSQKNLLNCCKN